MRREHHRRLFFGNGGLHFGNRCRCPGGLRFSGSLARLDHSVRGGDLAHVKNLRPAVAEPAVADDHHVFAAGKLAGHRFHAVGAAAGHQHGGMRAIDFLEHAGNVRHHALKALGHVVEGPVGVDHRKFEQAVRVDIG